MNKEQVKAIIDFSKGIEITDEDRNEQTIFIVESGWILTTKYLSHPLKKQLPNKSIKKIDKVIPEEGFYFVYNSPFISSLKTGVFWIIRGKI